MFSTDQLDPASAAVFAAVPADGASIDIEALAVACELPVRTVLRRLDLLRTAAAVYLPAGGGVARKM